MRRLIVNADDFGLTDGVNRAVLDLHRVGALPSSTLMAASTRFSEAVESAKQYPSLGVGCHIVLVDGSPVADPTTISSLLAPSDSRHGKPQFRSTLGGFVRDLMLGRIDQTHIEREATAQILRLCEAGVTVSHIDTHKHTHMFPPVLDAVTRAARACSVRAVRNPFEPQWSIAATPHASATRTLQVRMLRVLNRNFWRLVREREFLTTDGCLGVAATGTLDEATVRALVNRMPEGTWELVCHPAYMDDELMATRTRLQHSREIELSALQKLPDLLAGFSQTIQMINFSQLAGHRNAAERE